MFSCIFFPFFKSTLNLPCSEKKSLRVQVFLKLLSPKDVVIEIHSKAFFSKPCGSERVNESQKLLKSAEKYFYSTFSSFSAKLSQKKLFLIRPEILGQLDNTLTANYKYSRSNRENLLLPIQINFSEKPSMFSGVFFPFFESTLNLPCSGQKRNLIGQVFLKLLIRDTCSFNCIRKLVSEKPVALNMLTSLKNS